MRAGLFAALLAAGLVTACSFPCDDCSDGFVCRSDNDCPDTHEGRRFCDLATGQCALETRECARQYECCAGQVCVQGVYCRDDASPCEPDGGCDMPGQVCRNFGSGQVEEKGCLFEPCGTDGSCGDGLRCFDGVCVGVNPCLGGCPAGQACVPTTNKCFDVGDGSENDPSSDILVNRWPASCRVSCPAGSILSITATPLFNRCNTGAEACRCVEKVF